MINRMRWTAAWIAVLLSSSVVVTAVAIADDEVLVPVRGFRNRDAAGETKHAAGFRGDATAADKAAATASPTIPPGVEWPGPEVETPGGVIQEPPREAIERAAFEVPLPAAGIVETPATVLALKPIPDLPTAAESLATGAANTTGDPSAAAAAEWLTWPMIAALLVLAASIGGNIFLGWTTIGLRNRCRSLLRARM